MLDVIRRLGNVPSGPSVCIRDNLPARAARCAPEEYPGDHLGRSGSALLLVVDSRRAFGRRVGPPITLAPDWAGPSQPRNAGWGSCHRHAL
jgi:hypothetical protein